MIILELGPVTFSFFRSQVINGKREVGLYWGGILKPIIGSKNSFINSLVWFSSPSKGRAVTRVTVIEGAQK